MRQSNASGRKFVVATVGIVGQVEDWMVCRTYSLLRLKLFTRGMTAKRLVLSPRTANGCAGIVLSI